MSTTEPTTHPRFSDNQYTNGVVTTGSSCPPPPTIQSEVESISEALNAAGADQECKRIFDSSVTTDFNKVDVAVGISTPFGGAGAAASNTSAHTDLKTALTNAGCTDLFVNVQQQINSTQNIMCILNEKSQTSNISTSSNASIRIVQNSYPANSAAALAQIQYQTAATNALNRNIPQPPYTLPWYNEMSDTGKRIAHNSYEALLESITRRQAIIDKRTIIRGSTFSVSSNIQMKTVQNLDTNNITAIGVEAKKVATAQAMNEIEKRSGLGATGGNNIKSIVQNRIDNTTQNINSDISRTVSDIQARVVNSSEFRIEYYGAIVIDDIDVSVDAQARLITENIMILAKEIGSQVAMEVISEAASGNRAQTWDAGQNEALDSIMAGNVAMSEANAEGVSNALNTFMGGSGGMMGIIIIILIGIAIFMFGFKKVFSVVFPMTDPYGGPMKYVMQILIFLVIYLIIALIFRFWPFSSSEKNNKLMQSLEYSKRVFPPLGGEFSRRRDHERDRGLYGM
jgi:hypothetical protein